MWLCVFLCRDSIVCPDRHRLISHLDQSVLPASGVIEVRTFSSLSLLCCVNLFIHQTLQPREHCFTDLLYLQKSKSNKQEWISALSSALVVNVSPCCVRCSQVVPLYIKTASVFYGRIVQKDGGFQSMASEMTSYYADKKPGAEGMLEGGLYAVQEDEVFHRSDMKSKYTDWDL